MRALVLTVSFCVSATGLMAAGAEQRLRESSEVFNEIMSTPDKGIPQDLLDKAHCVVIIPGMKKGAFVIGGQYGRGFVACRNASGPGWGNPAAVRIEGGSFGFQIGASATDVVMLVMNKRGMDKLMNSKFTLGADASVAAGPVGRTAAAQTDANLTAEILAWSRSKGLFAGISLSGATLRPDRDEDRALYSKDVSTGDILTGNLPAPAAAEPLTTALNKYSPREQGASADRQAPPPKQ